jgi:hypothetical protein
VLLAAGSFLFEVVSPCRYTLGQDHDPSATVKAAAVACEANLASFHSYKCRFTITKAKAASLAKALGGELSSARKCEFLLVVDRGQMKFESFAPKKFEVPRDRGHGERQGRDRRVQGSMAAINVDFIPFADLELRESGMSYSALMGTAYVHSEEMKMEPREPTPLTYWGAFEPKEMESPTAHIRRCETGQESMIPKGITPINQVPT